MSFDFAARTSGVMSRADTVRQIRTRVLEGKTSYADVVRNIRPAALRVKTEQFKELDARSFSGSPPRKDR